MRLNGENDHPNTPITADADVSTSLSKFSFNTTNNIVSSKSSNNHSSIHTKMNVTTSTNTQNLPSSVQVAVRVRPILTSENGSHQCITIHHSAIDSTPSSSPNIANMVEIGSSGSNKGSKKFVFDACFSPKATQREVFEHSVQPLINACLDGYNATVLAYGQTGSGKTHTILGPSAESGFDNESTTSDNSCICYQQNNNDGASAVASSRHSSQAGVIPRALRELFFQLEKNSIKQTKERRQEPQIHCNADTSAPAYEYEVRVQFLELYGEEIRDLLSPSTSNKLVIRDGVNDNHEPDVVGAIEIKVHSAADALLCLTRGMMRRVTGATAMNAESSRSHAIMTVIVEQTIGGENENDDFESKRSKFHFVDLAGSERQKRSKAEGLRLKEGIDINKGLLVLGNVISALGDPKKKGKTFVPYRDSKLTRLLKGSLGGNHKTLMIACVSPSSLNIEESLNCLRYANRAKNIQNNAVLNVDSGSKLVNELRAQIQALAIELLSTQIYDSDKGIDKRFTNDMLRKLANGDDSSKMNFDVGTPQTESREDVDFTEGRFQTARIANLDASKAEMLTLKQTVKELQSKLLSKTEQLFTAKAEKEYYRLRVNLLNADTDKVGEKDESKLKFINQMSQYQREIENLKEELREVKANGIHDRQTNESEGKSSTLERQEFFEAEVFGNESNDLEAEVDKMTKKYIKLGNDGIEDEDKENLDSSRSDIDVEAEELFRNRQAHLDAHVLELAKGISAKEDLINQLKSSQTKYETMRIFYEEKLSKMAERFRDQVAEKNCLEIELKRYEKDSQKYKDLNVALGEKVKQIKHLRNRQSEIESLTLISSRNESIIEKLKDEVLTMKHQKVTLQKQLTHERKDHLKSLQQLKKQVLTQEKKATKVKQDLVNTIAQKERVQKIAKAHADIVNQLRSKYREAEKKLRMQTLKRGVMERAGIDPVLTGRNIKGRRPTSRSGLNSSFDLMSQTYSTIHVEKIRDYLNVKIAEIGRKEATADKLAIEWEDHLDLMNRKNELLSETESKSGNTHTDEIETIEFQIQYKESRIRHLARLLSTQPKQSTNIDDNNNYLHASIIHDCIFKETGSNIPEIAAAHLTSNVLFGMVVKERRRVAALARAAAILDQKRIDAETLASSKEVALRSYMEENKIERVAIAQSHQDKILSLMSMLHNDETGNCPDNNHTPSLPNTPRASIVLGLANERIDSLERQLEELKGEKETREQCELRELDTIQELKKVKRDYSQIMDETNQMRISLKAFRENISSPTFDLDGNESNYRMKVLSLIDDIINQATSPIKSHMRSKANSSPLAKLSVHDDSLSDDDDEAVDEVPDWANDIMKDLSIIAAGEVPPSLHKKERQSRKEYSVFDRLSNPENFTGTQKSSHDCLDDESSVTSSSRVFVRKDAATLMKVKSLMTPVRSRSRSSTPVRELKNNTLNFTPFQGSILKTASRSLLPTRISEMLRDNGRCATPNLELNLSKQNRTDSENEFINDYTKQDVFERLQNTMTNSYTLAHKSMSDEE